MVKELKSIKFPGLEDVYKIPAGGSGGTGQDGKDGITPTIGENGNWYLGDEDTGKPSRGATGPQGADGKDGTNGTDGADGRTPVITASKSGKVTTIKVDGEAVATVNDGADGTNGTDGAPGKDGADGAPGKDGTPGKDGLTPDIKIGTVTTLPAGSEATASMGGTAANPTLNLGIPKGADGDGANVTKDAVVGALGFTPISADDVPVKSVNGATGEVKSTFYVAVTQGNGYIATADKTAAEVYAAYEAGYAVYAIAKFRNISIPYTLPLEAAVNISGNVVFGFGAAGSTDPTQKPNYLCVAYNGEDWLAWNGTLAKASDIPTIPTALKNPNALNIKIGNSTTSYDGSAEKTVEIPEGTDGYSPSASVAQTATGATITITDKSGTTTAEIKNGEKGEKGDKGATGATGPQGPTGPQGETGPQGPTGPAGPDGTPGKNGKDGSPGATPNLQIGTVTTLPAGSDATANMGGTAENPLLNLGIPKGADGETGLPTVTADDNGKFLRVVNGTWAAAEIASAGGVSF